MMLISDILAGFFLGICYDVCKSFRKRCKKAIGTIFFDLLFWSISLTLCIRLFLLVGDRKFRCYELLGMGSGFSCYFLLISDFFVVISDKIADFFLFFSKKLFTSATFFVIIIKNGVLFLLSPLFFLFRLGKKRFLAGSRKWKRTRKLMKRI